ncbi:MAG TPA: restriction endonuclease, partial [Actinomycetota bacterium]|nr:restriction endonuclease [Actinomycetota bacterium]
MIIGRRRDDMAVNEQRGSDTGRAANLAQAVAEYLAHHGYRVARDVNMKGRSGANHSVDVLAEKSDEVTTYRLLVHTRSWDQAVDRDVVAGVHLMASDLGMSKAIVLGARHWPQGAEAAARRLGVELWGPVEIEGRLGRAPDPETGSALASIRGLRVNISEQTARDVAQRQRRGKLGVNREEIGWLRAYWLPFLPVRVRHTRDEGGRFSKTSPRTRIYVNVYEALGGQLFDQWDRDPETVRITENRVRAKVTSYSIVAEIEETAKRL